MKTSEELAKQVIDKLKRGEIKLEGTPPGDSYSLSLNDTAVLFDEYLELVVNESCKKLKPE